MNATVTARAAQTRSPWRAVALPDEHGGWSLTAEPALLGLLVPSRAGVPLSVAATAAFLTRTPLKLVLVDAWRHRCLPRPQMQRIRHGVVSTMAASRAELLGALVAISAVIADRRLLAGAVGVLATILVHVWWTQRAPLPVQVLGLTELGLGSGLVSLGAAGVQLR